MALVFLRISTIHPLLPTSTHIVGSIALLLFLSRKINDLAMSKYGRIAAKNYNMWWVTKSRIKRNEKTPNRTSGTGF